MESPTSSSGYQQRDLYASVLGDGRPLLLLTGLALVLAGGFALFLALSYQFLPHDIAFLGLTAEELCAIGNCRVVGFMIHDRIAFGGALVSAGLLYLWLTEFPLQAGHGWAWWLLAASGALGFGSFATYLNTGYLDTWHGLASLILLPCFTLGLARARRRLSPEQRRFSWRPGAPLEWRSGLGLGRLCLLLTGLGMLGAGLTILTIGSSVLFVPQDLLFMELTRDHLDAISPRLVPLIAHDRVGFGGAVATTGVLVLGAVWYSPPSRHLWQVLSLTSFIGFSTAIGAHPFVGYLDAIHLAPATLGAALCLAGLGLCRRPMLRPETSS